MRAFVVVIGFALVVSTGASAQIIQPVNAFNNPGESESKAAKAASQKETAAGANLLTQASAQAVGSDTTQIGLEAADLWINKYARLYVRLTLPVSQKASGSASSSNQSSSATTASTAATTNSSSSTLTDSNIKQLVDPYGGVLNLSGGIFRYLGRQPSDVAKASPAAPPAPSSGGTPGGATGGETLRNTQPNTSDAAQMVEMIRTNVVRRLKTAQSPGAGGAPAGGPPPDAAAVKSAVEQAASQVQPEHGAFLDIRGGFKFIDLPNAAGSAPSVGETKLNVFYTGIAGLKYIAHLYDAPTTGTDADDAHLAGGLTLAAHIVGNYAADTTQSDVFGTAVNRGTLALTASIGVNLPQIAALTFSFTPWTSDSRLGRTFVFGFNVLRPTKDPAPDTQASAPGEANTERARSAFRGIR